MLDTLFKYQIIINKFFRENQTLACHPKSPTLPSSRALPPFASRSRNASSQRPLNSRFHSRITILKRTSVSLALCAFPTCIASTWRSAWLPMLVTRLRPKRKVILASMSLHLMSSRSSTKTKSSSRSGPRSTLFFLLLILSLRRCQSLLDPSLPGSTDSPLLSARSLSAARLWTPALQSSSSWRRLPASPPPSEELTWPTMNSSRTSWCRSTSSPHSSRRAGTTLRQSTSSQLCLPQSRSCEQQNSRFVSIHLFTNQVSENSLIFLPTAPGAADQQRNSRAAATSGPSRELTLTLNTFSFFTITDGSALKCNFYITSIYVWRVFFCRNLYFIESSIRQIS